MATVVVVGAGPVGLFLAIQLRLRAAVLGLALRVVVLEKYKEYRRKHVLRLEAASLETGIVDEELDKSLRSLVGRTPTNRIEETFKKLASDAGVEVFYGEEVKDVAGLKARFPHAKYIVGADGRRSIVREQRFGDSLEDMRNVLKVAFCKYQVEGKTGGLNIVRLWSALHQSNHTINELVGRPKDGKTSVTLQIFVSAAEYDELKAAGFTFKNPGTPGSISKVCPSLSDSLDIWLEARNDQFREKRLDVPKINPVPLDVYQASKVILKDNAVGVCFALVGDAAFGLPFFRALNDGLLCATALSKAIVSDVKRCKDGDINDEKKIIKQSPGRDSASKKKKKIATAFASSAFTSSLSGPADPMEEYARYFTKLTWWEKKRVAMKAASVHSGVKVVASSRRVKRKKQHAAESVMSAAGLCSIS